MEILDNCLSGICDGMVGMRGTIEMRLYAGGCWLWRCLDETVGLGALTAIFDEIVAFGALQSIWNAQITCY